VEKIMSALELQSAMSDTLLQLVLTQKAQSKKQRELLAEQASSHTISSSKVYAKAA
jgi:hypothetical protein